LKDIPKLIHTVQNMGYKVSLKGDKITLKFIDKDDPPKEALTIINQIKENKAMVIEYLKNISLMYTIFMDAAYEISRVYQSPTPGYTVKISPMTCEKAVTIENKINTLWDEGKDVTGFQEAVKEWQDLHMKFIKLFNVKKGVDTVKDGVYNAPNGKPGPCQGLGKEKEEHGTL